MVKSGIQAFLAAVARSVIEVNHKASNFFDPYFPQTKLDIFDRYDETVTSYMNRRPWSVIVDAGGGKRCRFVRYREDKLRSKIICVDVSMAEMQSNLDVEEKRVADITRALPCTDAEADLVVSSSVLEHLETLSTFVTECSRVLKDDGYFIHVFSCKFAPFALLNQVLPTPVSKALLAFFFPGKSLGYRAFYDQCYPSGIRRLLERRGFEVNQIVVNYDQSGYFDFCLPFFLASRLYELLVWRLGLENLGAYSLVVARKSAKGFMGSDQQAAGNRNGHVSPPTTDCT